MMSVRATVINGSLFPRRGVLHKGARVHIPFNDDAVERGGDSREIGEHLRVVLLPAGDLDHNLLLLYIDQRRG
jgi:hypothetical protein